MYDSLQNKLLPQQPSTFYMQGGIPTNLKTYRRGNAKIVGHAGHHGYLL